MLGGDLDYRFEAESVEFERASTRAFVVGLVDDHHDRGLRRPQRRGDLFVARDQTFPSIDHKHKQVGGFHGTAAMGDHQFVQRIFAGAEHPARIDQIERSPLPVRRQSIDVAGRSGHRRDDGAARVGDSVEKCGLSNVRPSDDYHVGPAGDAFQRHAECELDRSLTA